MITTVYKSKIRLEVLIPILLILGFAAVSTFTEKAWGAFVIVSIVLIFFIHLLTTTFYIVTDKTVRVKCSVLINTLIEINSIKKITETNSFFSAPATSINRLEILFNENDCIVISPKEKSKFIDALKKNKSQD